MVKLCLAKNQVYAPVGIEIPNHGVDLLSSVFAAQRKKHILSRGGCGLLV